MSTHFTHSSSYYASEEDTKVLISTVSSISYLELLVGKPYGGSAADIFDLTDALDPAEPSQINPEKELCSNDARDIAFLIDGSTTVRPTEFTQMKLELFTAQKGARSTAKKFLVVLTDGEKFGDPLEYAEVIEEAKKARITRFAIGVGLVFTSKVAQRELHTIGSHPATDHVIVVRHFTGLPDIQTQLKEKICASHGLGVPHSTRAPPRSTDTCTPQSDPQVLQKLEQVLRGLDQVKTKLDLLEARQGKCGHRS
ncbi:hypothetical protein JD844_001617 [Phrynosoma platyrhinos]|uniref:VWFA domain-containing protein n=1 Tax=Phrynosoma platyrhinos TaxID=52577 RepID=A0ABQ7TA68_PHRPL|nr:hypothetical protein JD844_001617 [Phrynosoma platyrhinos]